MNSDRDRTEQRSATYWDTVCFDEGSRLKGSGTLLRMDRVPYRMFMESDDGSGRTNMPSPGSFPQGHSFHVLAMGIRLDLDGECAEDAARALLRCLRLTLSIGSMDYCDIPPGAFYRTDGRLPDRSVCNWHVLGTERRLTPCQNFHVRIDFVSNPGLCLLLKLQQDGLLRGELAVMLGGLERLDLL